MPDDWRGRALFVLFNYWGELIDVTGDWNDDWYEVAETAMGRKPDPGWYVAEWDGENDPTARYLGPLRFTSLAEVPDDR